MTVSHFFFEFRIFKGLLGLKTTKNDSKFVISRISHNHNSYRSEIFHVSHLEVSLGWFFPIFLICGREPLPKMAKTGPMGCFLNLAREGYILKNTNCENVNLIKQNIYKK